MTFATQLHCLFIQPLIFHLETDRSIDEKRQKLHDGNVRAIYGCKQVGAGHEHLKKNLFT